MKDDNMKQAMVERAQEALEETIRLFRKLEGQSCQAAETCVLSAKANANVTIALGHLMQAKGYATHAVNDAPDVTPQFGGK